MQNNSTLTTTSRDQLLEAQADLCLKNKYPHFAPTNGVCRSCGKDMVTEDWSRHLVTGCQHCHRSYVE